MRDSDFRRYDAIALSFGDGSEGKCTLTNKRGSWSTDVPATISVRRSDDALRYDCDTEDGREAVGTIASEVGAKIIASAVFIDFGITDAITDKHRKYAASFAIPVESKKDESENNIADTSVDSKKTDQTKERRDVYTELEKLDDLRDRGIITDAEFEAEKKELLESN